ncbi:3-methyladenine DNA glycosylase AlkC [Aliiruegeria haliotis]|uniref:3-methyladenine DNA glycosylase AlkC n=1 Tax=Aliiruegeria haliotis TaxID=1280846 RepID=A0A2T0RVM1_9RHOB|nr:hypothetical protein [Aliiruegeria haliotis]PRY25249.1 3-methyladenine DNA glycosylase AlkC [Aliiruegeria haliotis]
MTEDRFSLKDHLFNVEKVGLLAGWMAVADPGFDRSLFVEQVMGRLPELELKARIDWIATCLQAQLPDAFPQAAAVIFRALPPPLDPTRTDDDFGDFIIAPFGVVVERMGAEAHPDLSLDLFEALTQRFSMELSIRSFLNRWPEEVLARMERWVEHPNYHVRRLVSEGTRPRLPWAQKVTLDPLRPLPLLDRLHSDSTRYVTRSVANHLNDISKVSPEVVITRLAEWRAVGRQSEGELDWMTRHALRTRIKAGDPAAMELLGYRADADVVLEALEVPDAVAINDVAEIAVRLRAAQRERVIVDYVIDFATASGRRRQKVFKLKDTVVPAGNVVTLTKRHRFKGGATTFTLYPGRHVLRVQANGRILGERAFDLLAPNEG